jgi:hypothetical protein
MLNYAFHLEQIGMVWIGLDWFGNMVFDTYFDTCIMDF